MKKLTEGIKYLIYAIIAAIVGAITFIFGEKRDISLHERFIETRERGRYSNSIGLDDFQSVMYRNSKYFRGPKSKKAIVQLSKKAVENQIFLPNDLSFDEILELLRKKGSHLESNTLKPYAAFLFERKRKKDSILVYVRYENRVLTIKAVSSSGKVKSAKQLLQNIERYFV